MANHRRYPDCIVCARGHEILLSDEGRMAPYKTWKIYSSEGVSEPSLRIMPSTGAGCLYPYGSMPSVTFERKLIFESAFLADDVWMRFCSLQNGMKVIKIRKKIATLCNVFGSQKERLTCINDISGNNQIVIDGLMKVFPDTVERLLREEGKGN